MQINPFLMFEGRCQEAIDLYLSLFPDSAVLDIKRFPPGQPNEGKVMLARITLAGQTIQCNDSPVKHAFTFTPAMSLFVTCDSEAELDRLAAALSEGGKFLMPVGHYGFSRKFAWLDDRFGVSWQINLP